jgi:hypothetical protein
MPHARSIAVALTLCCALNGAPAGAQTAPAAHLDVYKSPTCGCCVKWMDHLAKYGISATARHDHLDDDFGVPADYRSCHTGVSSEGYVFEGHVPARYVRRFLADPPDGARGLAVPGMPVGSPGMEYKDEFTPYDILLLRDDGSVERYVTVDTYEQQFD